MASSRKLQGEIERVLKQITEHMAEFDQIWQKVHSAPTPNLKEKYEGDLKKEIKKLQRFRDQIKSWAASNDIKNKKPLLDARKAIETEMERFKVLEKETKTKAYSKEGLNSATRGRGGRQGSDGADSMDPREDPAKRDTFAWLDDVEEQLSEQVSEMDEKMEGLKANSKKKKSTQLDLQVDELQLKMDRHNFHIEQIQTIKDRLEHDELAVSLVEDIHDDLDYYLHSHNDVDFQEDETMYDALELDKEVERESSEAREDEGAPAGEGAFAVQLDDAAEEAAEEETPEENEAAGTLSAILKSAGAKPPKSSPSASSAAKGKSSTPASSPASASSSSVTPTAASIVKGRAGSNAAAAGPTPVVPSPPLTAGAGKQDLASIIKSQKQAAAPVAAPSAAAPAPAVSPPPSLASVAASPDKKAAAKAAQPAAPPSAVNTASLDQFMADTKKATPKLGASTPSPAPVSAPGQQGTPQPVAGPKTAAPVLPTIAPAQLGRMPPGAGKAPMSGAGTQPMMPPPGLVSQTPPPGLGLGTGVVGGASSGAGSAADLSGLPSSNIMSGGTGAAGSQLSSHKDRSLVPDDYLVTLSLLEPSLRNLPDPSDSERPRQYIPRNPYRTPACFPSLPAPIFDEPLLFDKLSVDTLFFIFYFQQGTPHQYLAARELKKQSWRYHKNFLTWFQRHDDPKVTTDEYEQGTYVYFDYESGWCQRIKADFTFEYRHLEDELAVPLAATL